jgi:hypothetical protein
MRKTLFSLIVLFLTSCSNNLSSSLVAPLSSSSNVDYSKMVRGVACSDDQDDRGHIKSQENVLDILMSMEENGIDEMKGNTFQQKVENYLLSVGVTSAEINSIREIFLGK